MPLGNRVEAEAVLKAQDGLLRCTSEDYRLLSQARVRSRRRRESMGAEQRLCSKSVAATHRAVAAAVAVARDVGAERSTRKTPKGSTFFSSPRQSFDTASWHGGDKKSRDSLSSRSAATRSRRHLCDDASSEAGSVASAPSGRPTRRTRSSSPAVAPRPFSSSLRGGGGGPNPFLSPVKKQETTAAIRRARSQSPAARRDPTVARTMPATERRTRSPSPARQSTPREPQRAATPRDSSRTGSFDRTSPKRGGPSTPTTKRASTPTKQTPETRRKEAPDRRRSHDLTSESPAALRRQILALTTDLNRLKERHRKAVGTAPPASSTPPF